MTGRRAVRGAAHGILTALAPGAAARWATDVFSDTRALGLRPDNVLPLGAQRFAVDGSPDVTGGYVWGEPGDGSPTALLVHGWASDSSSMHSFVGPLRGLGFTVAAFDAPAHGVWPGSQATMTQYSRAVAAVLESLGGARVVVAHSLGAVAAVSGLALRGEEPEALVLVAPTHTLSGVLDRWDGAGMRIGPGTRERVYAELHRRNGVPVSHWDAVARGASLRCPVLAVHDPADTWVPYADAEAIARALPGARLETVHGVGHIGILSDPGVQALITGFVAERAAVTPLTEK
ncbi:MULTISPECIES: alpha/beta fold hydrolase [unclassified Streptomyces]|uniref:alpha/beta fold hydrolase n=1 Tax=unclassified Streptomyces TaxID=2593676 RepID=UPI0035E2C8C2